MVQLQRKTEAADSKREAELEQMRQRMEELQGG